MRRKSFPFFAIPALLLTAFSVSLEAQTWRTTSGGAWSTAANWGGTLPTQDGTADLLFSQIGNPLFSRGTTTMDLDWNIRSVTWNATSLDSGRAQINGPGAGTILTLQAGLTNGSGGRVEIYPDIVLGGLQIWNDTTTPTNSFFNSPGTFISGTVSGAGGIQKTGVGTLRLNSNANTYGGGTVISGGVLEVPSAGALGGMATALQIDNGTLRFAPFPLTQISVALAQNLVLGANGGTIQTRLGDVAFNGAISGAGQLRLDPDPTWGSFTQSRYTWSGTNSYAGGTVLGAVTVNITGASQSLGMGGVTVKSDGVLGLSAETNLAAGQKVALKTGGVLVLNNAAINPANIIDSNPANTTGGILSLAADYGSVLNMATLGNGQLFLGSTGSVSYTASSIGAGSGGVYRLGGGSGANDSSALASILTFSGTNNVFTGARSVVIGSNSAFQTSDARGFSTVILRNANNYSSGTLAVGHDNALGIGALTITAGNFAGHLDSDGGARSIASPVVFGSPAGAAFYFGGASDLTLAGTVNLGGTSHIFFGNNPRTTFTNTISNGTLTLNTGTWTLAGTNTFSGGLFVADNASVSFSSDGNLGAAGAVITFQGGTLRPTSTVSISHPVSISSYGGNVDTNGQTLTLTGTVSGSGVLTKIGAGALIFSGSGKTLGATTIAKGTVRLDNTGSTGGMQVIVQDGGTLGGNGSASYTTLYSGGHLAPGTATPGSFLFNNDLNLSSGAILDFDLGPTLFDKIILGHGTLTKNDSGSPVGGPVLVSVFNAGGLAAGQTYTLIDWTTANASTITATDFQLTNSLIGGNLFIVGKTLQLTTTSAPEPGSLALLAGGAMFLVVGKRRRALGKTCG